MSHLVVHGGTPLQGRLVPSANKNAVLPILCATLLTRETVRLQRLPDITDVRKILEVFRQLGSRVVVDFGRGELEVQHRDTDFDARVHRLPQAMRSSIMLAAPLLARFGAARIENDVRGCTLGVREIDPHVEVFRRFGGEVERSDGSLLVRRTGLLAPTEHWLDYASVTTTENFMMCALLAEGRSGLVNAACEPHIQDLCRFLVSLGAQIDGIGSNMLHIEGVEELHGGEHRIGPEHVEVASFAALAAVTGGDVTIEDVEPDDLISIIPAFRKLGIRMDVTDRTLHVDAGQDLHIVDDLGGQIPKIDSGVWPAFPADLTSIALTCATQSHGTVLIFEKMFESRLFFVDKLVSMGARIILCDPHRAVVTGPAKLYAQRLESPDIRAGMAMLIAALCAEGTSTIGNIGQIDRGYERIDERLRDLGAVIERSEL
jgi:UDP-N-acetylglucosamine 1-carboxyvinyltransferase